MTETVRLTSRSMYDSKPKAVVDMEPRTMRSIIKQGIFQQNKDKSSKVKGCKGQESQVIVLGALFLCYVLAGLLYIVT